MTRDYFRLFGASTISNLGDGVAVVAYPWLASAITRNAVLVALVPVLQRLPWLVFSLPAGVITDRYDRRKLMVGANTVRAAVAAVVTAAVAIHAGSLASPADLEAGVEVTTNWTLYGVLLVATVITGLAEVLYDNTAQTVMPAIVDESLLEKANGRLWSTEQVANTLIGPVLGALMLAVTFALPFGVDAATFAISAALIATLGLKPRATPTTERKPWTTELADGMRWLWRHRFLRGLAISLGLLNMWIAAGFSTLVLFAQEVLDTSPTEFALMSTGGAAGGVIGGWVASSVSERLGPGRSLAIVVIVSALSSAAIGLSSNWIIVWAIFGLSMFFSVLWNVITVSLRQTIIPADILGRVNSVYRFFGWGMMPIGLLLGGIVVAVFEPLAGREQALRAPFLMSSIGLALLLVYTAPRLTTAKIEAARAAAKPIGEPA